MKAVLKEIFTIYCILIFLYALSEWLRDKYVRPVDHKFGRPGPWVLLLYIVVTFFWPVVIYKGLLSEKRRKEYRF
jgi:hypothetical protein